MQMKSDAQLLRDYASHGDEAAFREIVARHADLVYSAALRQVESPDLAGDVAQSVFVDLARKAKSVGDRLSTDASLTGWLYRSTRYTALNHLRDTRRRVTHERLAMEQLIANSEVAPDWEQIRPALDEVMSALDDDDREALLLRYFKNQDFRAVGLALGISDDAAQKRVSRAVERLRELFAERGVTVGVGGLVIVIAANAVEAAPVGLAATISTAALAGTTVTTATILTHAAMNWITLKSAAAITIAAVAAGTGTYLWQQNQISTLRNENSGLAAQRDSLTKERDDALAAAAKNTASDDLSAEKEELLRLRGEVGALRRQTNELSSLRQQNHQLQDALAQAAQSAPDADKLAAEKAAFIETMGNAKQMALGIIMYSADHQNHFPNDIMDTTNYFNNPDLMEKFKNQFEMVVQGSMENVSNAAETIAVRGRAPVQVEGKWVKVYAFVDGHAIVKQQPPEGFDAWEQAHMMPPPASQ
jgi:RNA polymerase sigma factor (sigma-70 family)